MELFLDTADVDDIKEVYSMGIISGVTTNPSIIAKEGRKFEEVIEEICSIVDGPISGEVKATNLDVDDMVLEGKEIAALHRNMVVKLPLTKEGLKACKQLSDLGIKTNMTLIFSASQALLAARAGATYVSPFVGRLDDVGAKGVELVYEISEIFDKHDIETKIIAASIRSPKHVVECAKAGADIATVPMIIIQQMIEHPLTQQGILKFQEDYSQVFDR